MNKLNDLSIDELEVVFTIRRKQNKTDDRVTPTVLKDVRVSEENQEILTLQVSDAPSVTQLISTVVGRMEYNATYDKVGRTYYFMKRIVDNAS